MEKLHRTRKSAMFQLKNRLQRAQVAHPNDAMPTDVPLEDQDGDEEQVLEFVPHCPDKPDEGNQKVKAQFGRKRTHNEQISHRWGGRRR